MYLLYVFNLIIEFLGLCGYVTKMLCWSAHLRRKMLHFPGEIFSPLSACFTRALSLFLTVLAFKRHFKATLTRIETKEERAQP